MNLSISRFRLNVRGVIPVSMHKATIGVELRDPMIESFIFFFLFGN